MDGAVEQGSELQHPALGFRAEDGVVVKIPLAAFGGAGGYGVSFDFAQASLSRFAGDDKGFPGPTVC
jgi:hypothetical protein